QVSDGLRYFGRERVAHRIQEPIQYLPLSPYCCRRHVAPVPGYALFSILASRPRCRVSSSVSDQAMARNVPILSVESRPIDDPHCPKFLFKLLSKTRGITGTAAQFAKHLVNKLEGDVLGRK